MRRPRAGTPPVLAVLLVVAAVACTTSRPTTSPTVSTGARPQVPAMLAGLLAGTGSPSGSWTVLGVGGAEHLELPRLGGRPLWCCPQNAIGD